MKLRYLGLCVSDLEASCRFYESALGCTLLRIATPEDDRMGDLLELQAPVGLRLATLQAGEIRLQLFSYPDRAPVAGRLLPMDQPGYTHLAIEVDDVPATLVRVAECGGRVRRGTDVGYGVFVEDPDRTRIELVPTA